MSDGLIIFDEQAGGYVLTQVEDGKTYRIIVPADLVESEAGADASHDERLDWVRDNLPNILSAMTAKRGGGIVREPWGRLIVEEDG